MDTLRRAAILIDLIQRLREHDNWCGETSIQKAVYLLQEVAGVDLGFEYILYKHGPFSFDLRDELTTQRANSLIALEPQGGYGPRFRTTPEGNALASRFTKTRENYESQLKWASDAIGTKGIFEIEALATAVWVTRAASAETDAEARAKCLHEIKPHFTLDEALAAVTDADKLIDRAKRL